MAEYRIQYGIGWRTLIMHAHRAPLIDWLGHATWSATKASSYLSQAIASCVIVSRFRAALDLDTYPLRNLIRPRCAERAINLVEVSQCSLWIFRLFSRHISRTQLFQQNRHITFLALVALKLLVSLISRHVACSARIVVDKHTDRQTIDLIPYGTRSI